MSDALALDGGAALRTEPFPTVADGSGHSLGPEEAAAVLEVLQTGRLNSTVGNETRTFEAEFASYFGTDFAVASSSGTAAIHLAIAAINPNPGDEIITTGLSDAGTVLPILAQNAVPVFADVDPRTGNISVESVRKRISPRTKAIVLVHLFGQPAPAHELRKLADETGIYLIEDCAQAYLTTTPRGSLAGTVGHIGCFSLQQSKHITAGDGGLTITDDPTLARRARLFADKAWPRDTNERTHLFFALNYRMTEMQAAIGRAQLKKLRGIVDERRRLANTLISRVTELEGLRPACATGNAWWLFPIFLDQNAAGADGSWYAAALQAEGVPVSKGYIQRPLYRTPMIADALTYGSSGYPLRQPGAPRAVYDVGICPVTEDLIGGALLTIAWNERYTDQDVEDIAKALEKVHRAALLRRSID